ncbi:MULTISPECIES: ring-cleaving dioxygenase [unclassified Haladaptatus]|uniref:ring-cleaving dioxygenase n=1 Tax=unclassified Haladaptatus TaxID=2622732 RepID=UPI0023E78C40|nr:MULTISPECIES: ring-cleaving dioxygenase [unclassified Haladaptatus]
MTSDFDPTEGIHHVTALASDPQRNVDFYTETLGLRLVKQSVNQDEVHTYHLFYGDGAGSPGTSMTFFPIEHARPGRAGAGMAQTTSFLVDPDAVDYWVERFEDLGVEYSDPEQRADETVVPFRDPDGLQLELVAHPDAPAGTPWDESPVPAENQIRGFFGVTLALRAAGPTADLLSAMGYERVGDVDAERQRFRSSGDRGFVVDIVEDSDRERGVPGAGTVHHVAFRVPNDEVHESWRKALVARQLNVTDIIDRKWFHSIYFREPGGVLFEIATENPGYTVDEELDALGTSLVLPEWLEGRREEIEANLPPLDVSRPATMEAEQ